MNPIDKKLRQELAEGPFAQNGFTDALRKRIEERIEAEETLSSRSSRRKPLWMAGAGAAVTAALLFFAVDGDRLFSPPAALTPEAGPVTTTASYEAADYESTIRSALLVGLRTDRTDAGPSGETSEYRTLLIAPDPNKLQVVAEGSGILMPYRMDFWRLSEERTDAGEDGAYVRWTAALADPSKPVTGSSKAVSERDGLRTEKLLFVGNRYVAVEQTVMTRDGKGAWKDASYVWVKDIPQLAADTNAGELPLRQPHVTLRDLYGNDAESALRTLAPAKPLNPGERAPKAAASDAAGESWTIARHQGRWIAKVASYENEAGGATSGYRLKDVPLALPEEVVSHDRLVPDWGQIKQVQPAAVDAYSSPNQDVVLIVTDRHLIVYPYNDGLLPTPLLTIETGPRESVIMAQWAIDPYIEPWKKNVRTLLAQ